MVYWLTRMATWLAARTPRPIRVSLAGTVAVLVYYAWPAKRRVTIANMAQVLGAAPNDPRTHRLARASWYNYGRYAADFLHASGGGQATKTEVLAHVRDTTLPSGALVLAEPALARGNGLIMVTAHFGNWDVAGMYGAYLHHPLHVVVERFADERMDQLVQSQRRALGMEVLWMEKSPRQMVRVLQQNGIVAIVVDRPLAEGEGVSVTFFGRRCYVPGGVAQLALLTGAAIFPCFAHYDERGSSTLEFGLLPPLLPESSGNRKADTQALTQRLFTALEEIIRPFPDQWYMFRPFWPAEMSEPADGADDTTDETLSSSSRAARTAEQGGADG